MNKAVFLDRDGVINEELGTHVTSWKDFRLIPEAAEGLQLLQGNGYKLIVVTNQSGVAKGLYKESDLVEMHENMLASLRAHGVEIDAIYYCPHAEEARCACRKPETGMLKQAQRDHNIDFSKSFMIGDSQRDVIAGNAVGCRSVLISKDIVHKAVGEFSPHHVAGNLLDAAKIITGISENV